MKLAVWCPLPPSPSGIADYAAEQLDGLRRRFDVVVVAEDDAARDPAADLHLYHLGNSPAHGYVYRAARARPGVVILHDWVLHDLVLAETVARGDRAAYLREMRRAHGAEGTFVGLQVARALGGRLLPTRYPLNDRVLDSALGLVGLTAFVASRAAGRVRGPVLHLPHHVSLPRPLPSRADARRALGLPDDALVVTAPGLATASKRLPSLLGAVARLRGRHPALRLVVAGGVEDGLPLAEWSRAAGLGDALLVTGRLELSDFVRHLVAADVVATLRFPSHGEMSGALVRALGVGRPALVTAGTPAADEFPEGCVIPVDPGAAEAAHLEALLERLLGDVGLREAIGRLARAHVTARHDLGATVARLADFLEEVHGRQAALAAEIERRRVPEGTLGGFLGDEVRWAARDLGLSDVPPEIEPLLAALSRADED